MNPFQSWTPEPLSTPDCAKGVLSALGHVYQVFSMGSHPHEKGCTLAENDADPMCLGRFTRQEKLSASAAPAPGGLRPWTPQGFLKADVISPISRTVLS
jgi:hypothetical protein